MSTRLIPTDGWIFDSNGRPYYDNLCTLESRRRWNAATMTDEDRLIADAIYVADQERATASAKDVTQKGKAKRGGLKAKREEWAAAKRKTETRYAILGVFTAKSLAEMENIDSLLEQFHARSPVMIDNVDPLMDEWMKAYG